MSKMRMRWQTQERVSANFANVKGEVGALSGAPTVQVLFLYQESNSGEKMFLT